MVIVRLATPIRMVTKGYQSGCTTGSGSFWRSDSLRFPFPYTGIPDENDRHVLAAAICGHAHVIVTNNLKDFPKEYLAQFDILCQSPDDFLIHQFHLSPYLALEKLDEQALNIRQQKGEVLNTLKQLAPGFVAIVEKNL